MTAQVFEIISLITVGISLALGYINLIAGTQKGGDRAYLFFGIIGLAVAGYFLLPWLAPSEGDNSAFGKFRMLFAYIFYPAFPWFASFYTKYYRPKICWAITFLALLSYLLLLFGPSSEGPHSVWGVSSHFILIGVGIYGSIAAVHLVKFKKELSDGKAFLLCMVLYDSLLLDELIGNYLGADWSIIPNIGAPPLDFFPLLFMILMGYRLARETQLRRQLDKMFHLKDEHWNTLLDNISLLVLITDRKGQLVYVNPYFLAFTKISAKKIIRKNWFSHFHETSQKKEEARLRFNEALQTSDKFISGQDLIHLPDGKKKMIFWSSVPLRNEKGEVESLISIGVDITERQRALSEIMELKSRLEKENLLLKEQIKFTQNKIIGESKAIKYALNRAYQVAPTDASVLLEGETGVGKELFAELIHERSKRSKKPFVRINCTTLPHELIESELFGHEKGAFTGAVQQRKGRFEQADGGTLFLDEIGEFPLTLQPKLLRVLQKGEFQRIGGQKTISVDVRIISATNRNLKEEAEAGRFREDLYYRLNVYPITIPPLRKRRSDIPLLTRFFVDRIGKRMGKDITNISKKDMNDILQQDWPGNVRELENFIERALITSSGPTLQVDSQIQPLDSAPSSFSHDPLEQFHFSLEEMERWYIEKTLQTCNWKINGEGGAADRLQIHPSTLRSKMKKLQIERPESPQA